MPIIDWDKTHKTYAVNKDDFQRNPLGMVNQQTTSYASDLGKPRKPRHSPSPAEPAALAAHPASSLTTRPTWMTCTTR